MIKCEVSYDGWKLIQRIQAAVTNSQEQSFINRSFKLDFEYGLVSQCVKETFDRT